MMHESKGAEVSEKCIWSKEKKTREGEVLYFLSILLLCACLEWAEMADEWLIPAFRLTRSNF